MAHLHSENINGKDVIFYTSDDGTIWIRAFTLFQAVGVKAPGAAVRFHVNHYPGVCEKFNYPANTTGSVEGKFTSGAWHFTYAMAMETLKTMRAAGAGKVRKAVDSTVKMLTADYLARVTAAAPVAPAKAAKAKPAPSTGNQHAATVEWLTAILTDTTNPPYLHLKALNARTLILELEDALNARARTLEKMASND